MLKLNDLEIVEQILWFFANCCGDSKVLRDKVLQRTSIMQAMTRIISTNSLYKSVLRTICWCNTNIVRQKNLELEDVKTFISNLMLVD